MSGKHPGESKGADAETRPAAMPESKQFIYQFVRAQAPSFKPSTDIIYRYCPPFNTYSKY